MEYGRGRSLARSRDSGRRMCYPIKKRGDGEENSEEVPSSATDREGTGTEGPNKTGVWISVCPTALFDASQTVNKPLAKVTVIRRVKTPRKHASKA